MRTILLFAVVLAVLLVSSSSRAHFKLEQPVDWLQTDANGDPLGAGGTQKMNPCGAGTPSGLITQVESGSTLHIKLVETVPHGGHYRVAFVPKYGLASSDAPEPAVTLASGSCDSATIEAPVVAPVLADGLFVHTQAQAVSGKVWETDVQLPNHLGPGTLQIIEFMTPHPPQCFYHHCAQLELVSADAGAGDGGVVVGSDGGAVSDGGGGRDGGVGTGGDASSGGGSDSGAGPSPNLNSGQGGGCALGGSTAPSTMSLGVLGLTLASILRRRRRMR